MNAHIARHDRSTRKNGEDIRIRRPAGTSPQQFTIVDVRAHVSGVTEEQLQAGIDQATFNCIFSPTAINAEQWPGGQPPNTTLDVRIPSKNKGDQAYVRGAWRAVEWGEGFYPGGELVRIEIRTKG